MKIVFSIGLLFALAIGGGLKLTPAGIYVKSFIDPRYASNEERLEFVARLIAPMTNVEAMVGKGLGDVMLQNFRQSDIEIYDLATGNSRSVQLIKNQTLVDNQYLKTGVEMGLVGLLIYGWIYWRFFRTCRINSNEFSPTSRIVGLWGGGFLTVFVIQAFFIDIWDIWPTNAMFWIVAALTAARSQMVLTDRNRNNKGQGRISV